MKKINLILVIIITLLLSAFTVAYFFPQAKNEPVSHTAVKLILDQTPSYTIALKSLSIEDVYASDYKLEIPYGYYTVKIFDAGGKELFSGKAAKDRVSFPPYEITAEDEVPSSTNISVSPLTEINLLLPFFIQANKIIFYDDKNLEKLRVDVSKLTLPKDFSKKLCGNGICDYNENWLKCFKDCNIRKAK